ncbi:MAG: glutamate ligase domain-containing protein, partial [Microgenomates group bacterium]
IRKAVASFEGVIGRMEEIDEGQNFRVIIDFAHTPNALEQVLKTLREQLSAGQRLIVVFGAAGLRDKAKRPLMGKVAGRLADFVVITAEDPRTEKVADICQQIASGCGEVGKKYEIIPERQKAIEHAIVNLARKGDIVVVCGKGHEKSMCFGKKEYPWSDQAAVKKAIKDLMDKRISVDRSISKRKQKVREQ